MPSTTLLYDLQLEDGVRLEYYAVGLDELRAALLRVANNVESVQVPLLEAREIARKDTDEHFKNLESPEGEPWALNTKEWFDRKVNNAYNPDPLHMTGALAEAAPDAWEVVGSTLIFNDKRLPDNLGDNYGVINHFGREADPVTVAFLRAAGSAQVAPERLPARPFIGLSGDAQDEIEAVFVTWLDRVVEDFEYPVITERSIGGIPESFYRANKSEFIVHPGGRVQARGFGGKFGRIVGQLT
jgi:phage gpG-like protein